MNCLRKSFLALFFGSHFFIEQWGEALENRGMKVSRAKTEDRVHVSEWNAMIKC